jgi:hypothetical protein
MECKDEKGDGGLCPDVQITVVDMAERRCIDDRPEAELLNATRGTVPCILCQVDIAGAFMPGAVDELQKMHSDGNEYLKKLAVRGLTEEVMYDKCLEFLGCFPEKVKFEEAVVCGTIVTVLAVGAFLIWKSGSSAAGQVAPAPAKGVNGGNGEKMQPVKQPKPLRTAFKGLAM